MVDIIYLEREIAVAPQLVEADFAAIAERGFRSIVAIRPDGEAPDQLPHAQAATAAQRHGLAFRYHPVSSVKAIDDETVEIFARFMDDLPGPILFYCGTGTRCTILWSQAAAARLGVNATLAVARDAGYELEFLRDILRERGNWFGAVPTPVAAPANACGGAL